MSEVVCEIKRCAFNSHFRCYAPGIRICPTGLSAECRTYLPEESSGEAQFNFLEGGQSPSFAATEFGKELTPMDVPANAVRIECGATQCNRNCQSLCGAKIISVGCSAGLTQIQCKSFSSNDA